MTATQALQSALAAEHAAVFVLGALGAHASETEEPGLHGRLTEAYRTHQDRAATWTRMLRALGAAPVAAAPAYELPEGRTSGQALRRRALRVERACGASYAHVVANTAADTRRVAVDALLDSATRELAFGGKPRPLPGL